MRTAALPGRRRPPCSGRPSSLTRARAAAPRSLTLCAALLALVGGACDSSLSRDADSAPPAADSGPHPRQDGPPPTEAGLPPDAAGPRDAGDSGAPPDAAVPPVDAGPIPANALAVNVTKPVRPFDRRMTGIALANWTFTKAWNKPFVGEIKGLPQAIKAIDPGIIRYAGGLWANHVGFDRTKNQQPAKTAWTKGGMTYYYSYGIDELASVHAFAKAVGAEVMIQVNVSNDDPAMWADLVRYAKEQGFSTFRYYELSNELDLLVFQGDSAQVAADAYASRVAAYQKAMLAVDPTIKIVGGVPAAATDIFRTKFSGGGNEVSRYITKALPAARGAGQDLSAVSYHWYQTNGNSDVSKVTEWSFNIQPSSPDFWRASYSREWSRLVPAFISSKALSGYAGTEQGVSELGVDSADNIALDGNHVAALWYSDVLGRLAYSGVDWVTQWDSYASSGEYFSLLYCDDPSSNTPTIHARPTYAAYLMYAQYFGDQLVESRSPDPAKISIWASTDSQEPGKLKLRVTNLGSADITAPIYTTGFSATSGEAYELTSTKPTDVSAASVTSQAPTTINGVKVDAMDVAGTLASIQPKAVSVSGTHFTYTVPAYSSVAIILGK